MRQELMGRLRQAAVDAGWTLNPNKRQQSASQMVFFWGWNCTQLCGDYTKPWNKDVSKNRGTPKSSILIGFSMK